MIKFRVIGPLTSATEDKNKVVRPAAGESLR